MDEFKKDYPNLAFIKSKIRIEEQGGMKDENFIFDDDTPTLVKNATTVMPLITRVTSMEPPSTSATTDTTPSTKRCATIR